jgi:hypothetical protein
METMNPEIVLFAITIGDVQNEAKEKLGRELTPEEILMTRKGLESGLLTDIHTVYNTIFSEMLEQ